MRYREVPPASGWVTAGDEQWALAKFASGVFDDEQMDVGSTASWGLLGSVATTATTSRVRAKRRDLDAT